MDEKEIQKLDKHALEHLELSVLHASDWMKYYAEYGPVYRYQQWSNTFEHRRNLLRIAVESYRTTHNSGVPAILPADDASTA